MTMTICASTPRTAAAPMRLDAPAPVPPSACPVEEWLAFLGHRWNALVLWHLNASALRHGELMARLPGITAKVLSERLALLQQRGLVRREVAAAFPRTVRYTLTPHSRGLLPLLDGLERWSKQPG